MEFVSYEHQFKYEILLNQLVDAILYSVPGKLLQMELSTD